MILVSHANILKSEVWKAIVEGAIAEAKKLGMKLRIFSPKSYDSQKEFCSLVKKAVEEEPDVLILPFTPTEPGLAEEMMEILQRFSGKMVAINVPPTPETIRILPNIAGYVGMNEKAAGAEAAKTLLSDNKKTDELVIAEHKKNHLGHLLRVKGIEEIAKKCGVRVTEVFVGAEDQNIEALKKVLSNKTKVITLGNRGTETALQAAKETGIKVQIVSMDLNKEVVAAIRNGKIFATLLQHPKREGELAVKLASLAVKGKMPYAEEFCGPTKVTKDNLNVFHGQ